MADRTCDSGVHSPANPRAVLIGRLDLIELACAHVLDGRVGVDDQFAVLIALEGAPALERGHAMLCGEQDIGGDDRRRADALPDELGNRGILVRGAADDGRARRSHLRLRVTASLQRRGPAPRSVPLSIESTTSTPRPNVYSVHEKDGTIRRQGRGLRPGRQPLRTAP